MTGASRGIGAAVAIDLARAGADVVVNYCRSPQPAAAVQAEIEKLGRKALVVKADVARCEEIRTACSTRSNRNGGRSTSWSTTPALKNAGPRATAEESNYDAIMDTNLKGAFFCASAALEGMKAKGWGRVINISSVHEVMPTGLLQRVWHEQGRHGR